jgi:hypothetical protein
MRPRSVIDKIRNGSISLISDLRRALQLWPYGFVAVSIAGLAYIALNSADEEIAALQIYVATRPFSILTVATHYLELPL